MISDEGDFGKGELRETIRGGERVLIRPVRPEDMALYPGFLRDVSAADLRLRFFAHIAELSPRRSKSSAISTTGTKWPSSHSTKTRAGCSGSCA